MEDELTANEIDDSLEDQGFNPAWDSERWNDALEEQFKDEVADDDVGVDSDGFLADDAEPLAAAEAPAELREETDIAPDYVDVGGTRIPLDEADRLGRFWDWMNQNPSEALDFAGYMVGDYELVPRGAAPAAAYEPSGHYDPSQDIDTEDWDLLPESVQTQLKKVTQLEQTLNYQQNAIAQQQYLEQSRTQQQSMSNVEVAKNHFAQQYDLDEETVAEIVTTAARLNVVPALMAETRDPIASVYRALEISYLQSDTGREREFGRRLSAVDNDQARQRRLSAVGGTGGNVPRTTETLPNTKEGRREAMVNEIAAAIRGG